MTSVFLKTSKGHLATRMQLKSINRELRMDLMRVIINPKEISQSSTWVSSPWTLYIHTSIQHSRLNTTPSPSLNLKWYLSQFSIWWDRQGSILNNFQLWTPLKIRQVRIVRRCHTLNLSEEQPTPLSFKWCTKWSTSLTSTMWNWTQVTRTCFTKKTKYKGPLSRQDKLLPSPTRPWEQWASQEVAPSSQSSRSLLSQSVTSGKLSMPAEIDPRSHQGLNSPSIASRHRKKSPKSDLMCQKAMLVQGLGIGSGMVGKRLAPKQLQLPNRPMGQLRFQKLHPKLRLKRVWSKRFQSRIQDPSQEKIVSKGASEPLLVLEMLQIPVEASYMPLQFMTPTS